MPETPCSATCGVAPETPRKAVLLFGRMNPPTIGHIQAVAELRRVADENGAVPLLYLSRSHDKKASLKNKNPLSFDDKCALVNQFAGIPIRNEFNPEIRTPLDALFAHNGEFDEITLMGDGAIEDGPWTRYNHSFYHYWKLGTATSGYRDDSSDDLVTSASATRARSLAAAGDWEGFSRIVTVDTERAWVLVRAGLGVVHRESVAK